MKSKCFDYYFYRHKFNYICSHLLISLPISPAVLHKVLARSVYPKNFSRFPEMHVEVKQDFNKEDKATEQY